MSSSTAASNTNYLENGEHQEHKSLEEIHDDLRNVFRKKNFKSFTQECKQVTSYLEKYPIPLYSSVKFNLTKHKPSFTTAEDYLCRLTDEDPNVDLKTMKPAEVITDGSTLFRAIMLLLGFSLEENVLELRLRCLLHAISNLKSYVHKYEELEPLIVSRRNNYCTVVEFHT